MLCNRILSEVFDIDGRTIKYYHQPNCILPQAYLSKRENHAQNKLKHKYETSILRFISQAKLEVTGILENV